MTAPKIKPISEQRAFQIHELFFSTTDKRGVIRFGNATFCRIAAYPLPSMVGEPHNIIRHPDMPRCAFRLVWDYLKQDRVVAAYVKNMASDGRFYWVLALIVPTDDGYLSIRLKPTSEVFGVVQEAYIALKQIEDEAMAAGASGTEAMDAGANKLMELLGGLGFNSYDEFMWAALSAEMTARDGLISERRTGGADGGVDESSGALSSAAVEAARADGGRLVELFKRSSDLDRQLGSVFAKPGTFSRLRDEIIPKSKFILDLGHSIRLQAINAEVQAARLGDMAGALSMVAERLGQHADEGAQTITQLNDRLRRLVTPIAELVFNSLLSKIQVEMAADFVREIMHLNPDGETATEEQGRQIAENLDLLFSVFLSTVRRVPVELDRLQAELGEIDHDVRRLSKFVRTLRFIHLAGRIETARQTDAMSFGTIFDQVGAMIDESENVLTDLLEQVEANRHQIQSIGNVDARVFDEIDALLAA